MKYYSMILNWFSIGLIMLKRLIKLLMYTSVWRKIKIGAQNQYFYLNYAIDTEK